MAKDYNKLFSESLSGSRRGTPKFDNGGNIRTNPETGEVEVKSETGEWVSMGETMAPMFDNVTGEIIGSNRIPTDQSDPEFWSYHYQVTDPETGQVTIKRNSESIGRQQPTQSSQGQSVYVEDSNPELEQQARDLGPGFVVVGNEIVQQPYTENVQDGKLIPTKESKWNDNSNSGSGFDNIDGEGNLVGDRRYYRNQARGTRDERAWYRNSDPVPLLAKNTDYAAFTLGQALGAPKGTRGRGMGIVSGAGDFLLGSARNFVSGMADAKDTRRVYRESMEDMDRMNRNYTEDRRQYRDPSGRYKYGALFSDSSSEYAYGGKKKKYVGGGMEELGDLGSMNINSNPYMDQSSMNGPVMPQNEDDRTGLFNQYGSEDFQSDDRVDHGIGYDRKEARGIRKRTNKRIRQGYVDPVTGVDYGNFKRTKTKDFMGNMNRTNFEEGGQMPPQQGDPRQQPQQEQAQQQQQAQQDAAEMAAKLIEKLGPDLGKIEKFLLQEGIEESVSNLIMSFVQQMIASQQPQQEERMPSPSGSSVMRNTMSGNMEMPIEFRGGGRYPKLY
jgi:hypothetical protein